MDLKLEKSLWRKGYDAVIGIDEVGRGSLAGPMYLCAVILKREQEDVFKKIKGVNDSKQLSQKKREAIFEQATTLHVPYIVYKASPKEIDRYNIYRAGIRGCGALVKKYGTQECNSFFVACDGGLFVPGLEKMRQETFIKGDRRVFAIALASVIAKCLRDALMVRLAKKYHRYGWEHNKGYGTKFHRDAIFKHGSSNLHRTSFLRGI